MKLLAALLIVIVSAVPSYLVFRRGRAFGRISRRLALVSAGLGGAAAALAFVIERAVLIFTELSFDARAAGVGSALLASFLVAAPLEEALKTLIVWPLYRTRRIDTPRLGVCYAVVGAGGFAAVLGICKLWTGAFSSALVLRALCQAPAQLFCAGVWGYALGAKSGRSGGWFSITWLTAVALHGLYDHIVWGRGPGFLIAVVPLLLFMVIGAASALSEVAPTAPESFGRSSLHLPEPPRLSLVQDALRPKDRPLMLRWVVLGAFVNIGLMLALLAGAILLGHRIGIDFAAADETDMRSAGPLLLLGSALLAAFPLGGYLVARGSASHGVLESALAAVLALAALISLLGLVAPLGVLFTLAVAPLAFGLACGGAWIGMER